MFISKEIYRGLIADRDKARKELEEALLKNTSDDIHLQDRLHELLSQNIMLEKENACLRTLIDKEADTEVIKCNGRLFKIISKTLHMPENDVKYLEVDARDEE